MTRYQDCPWYVRLWRRRWYLCIPWWTWNFKGGEWVNPDTGELAKEDPYTSWHLAWKLAIGTAQGKMEWYYTWEEVKASLGITDDYLEDIEDDDDIEDDI